MKNLFILGIFLVCMNIGLFARMNSMGHGYFGAVSNGSGNYSVGFHMIICYDSWVNSMVLAIDYSGPDNRAFTLIENENPKLFNYVSTQLNAILLGKDMKHITVYYDDTVHSRDLEIMTFLGSHDYFTLKGLKIMHAD